MFVLVFLFLIYWQGKKDSNLRMLESKSSALTNLAIPLRNSLFTVALANAFSPNTALYATLNQSFDYDLCEKASG